MINKFRFLTIFYHLLLKSGERFVMRSNRSPPIESFVTACSYFISSGELHALIFQQTQTISDYASHYHSCQMPYEYL